MSIGSNIRRLRKENGKTQEQLAEAVGVTFQAISSWERDEYVPEMSNLFELADEFNVSVAAILEDKEGTFKTKEAIYDWTHMRTYIKTTAKNYKMADTLKAIDFAQEAHSGQTRKRTDLPYISHPMNVACHALALGLTDDVIVAACLLHDVVEDCGVNVEDLPVSEETRELVSLMTHPDTNDDNRTEIMDAYFKALAANPKAALIKCLDRCNNLTTMSWGLSREGIFRYIRETEKYFPPLIKVLKNTVEYNNAAWLLKYHIESMLDIYKRLI